MLGFFNILYRFIWRESKKDPLSQEFLPDVIDALRGRHIMLGSRWSGGSSGVLMDHTHILTAKHCWKNARKPKRIRLKWNGQVFWVKAVLYQSFGTDIDAVVLKICNYIFPVHSVRPADAIRMNSPIFSFNSMLSWKKVRTYFGRIIGTISPWVVKYIGWPYSTLISKGERPSMNGMSGSGIYDKDGNLAGILVGSFPFRQHTYIVPVNDFKRAFEKQKKTVA
ncbi:trypsin-like peptidase domain-containing protein [Patescibacteria group bacterium AH-259-L05]|nr:trypsin-like peptidase domain-containing protein [Patescibacteria group bacterium AH-259-L05]